MTNNNLKQGAARSSTGAAQELYIVWALPAGMTDRIEEQPLVSAPVSIANAKRVQIAASKDGWHSFRFVLDDNAIPDFTSARNINI